jgi:hypothetical protein
MATTGNYLYGFTQACLQPPPDLRGLANAPVRLLGFRDVAAVVSNHPVRQLMPKRANLEPHHRIIHDICKRGPLVPVAFGHISESEEDVVGVLRENYEDIREEIDRLANTVEVTVRLRWNVENIFEYFVRNHRDLRELRDRVFRNPQPSHDDKLEVGSRFEARLAAERERLTALLLKSLGDIVIESTVNPPRDEKTVCECALLVEGATSQEFGFGAALERTAAIFDSSLALQWSGPWPPYSFVRLQVQAADRPAMP